MKKTALLNGPLSAVIAHMGHTDAITLCDAGLPIPDGPERIDLALVQGAPEFLSVLQAMATELEIERIVIAEEMQKISPQFFDAFNKIVKELGAKQRNPIKVETVPHVEFKRMTQDSRAIVRTGECTYYANAIIYCGVAF